MALIGRTQPMTPGEAARRIAAVGGALVRRNAQNGRALYKHGARYVVYIPVAGGQVVLEEHNAECGCGV